MLWAAYGRTGCDCSEALLAGGIPNLELDPLSVQLDGANLEVNAAPADAPPTGSDDEGMSTGRF